MPAKKRAFISFDYDHDLDLKTMLVGQARLSDSPFDIADFSIKEAIQTNWQQSARTKIKGCDVVIVICGQYTDRATGVSVEVRIAKEEGVSYFLLCGRPDKNCVKPAAAGSQDEIYEWTWDNLKNLIHGGR